MPGPCLLYTSPYPNPEIREAMQKGLELCDKVRPALLLGTDPDCDRCGTAVPDGKRGYRLITGNEMGALLRDYLCRTRLPQGTMPADPVAVTTIVSTAMATPVAKKYGVEPVSYTHLPELHRQLVFFDHDYNSLIDLYSYGHDIETSWLIDWGTRPVSYTHLRRREAL